MKFLLEEISDKDFMVWLETRGRDWAYDKLYPGLTAFFRDEELIAFVSYDSDSRDVYIREDLL